MLKLDHITISLTKDTTKKIAEKSEIRISESETNLKSRFSKFQTIYLEIRILDICICFELRPPARGPASRSLAEGRRFDEGRTSCFEFYRPLSICQSAPSGADR